MNNTTETLKEQVPWVNGGQPFTYEEAQAYCECDSVELLGTIERMGGFLFQSHPDKYGRILSEHFTYGQLYRLLGPEVAHLVTGLPSNRFPLPVRLRMELREEVMP